MIRTIRAPINIESEFQNGIVKASPSPIADGMYFEAFGAHFSTSGMMIPIATPTSIAILAV